MDRDMENQNPTQRDRREAFLIAQLGHAHAMDARVDGSRFTILQLLLGLHGAVLVALFTRESGMTNLPVVILTSVLYLIIGLGIYTMFVSQHYYTRRYKKWIKNIEILLTQSHQPSLQRTTHSGTYYRDDNTPEIASPCNDYTLLASLLVAGTLNSAIPALVVAWLLDLGLLYAALCLCAYLTIGGLLHYCIWQVVSTNATKRRDDTGKVPLDANHILPNGVTESAAIGATLQAEQQVAADPK